MSFVFFQSCDIWSLDTLAKKVQDEPLGWEKTKSHSHNEGPIEVKGWCLGRSLHWPRENRPHIDFGVRWQQGAHY